MCDAVVFLTNENVRRSLQFSSQKVTLYNVMVGSSFLCYSTKLQKMQCIHGIAQRIPESENIKRMVTTTNKPASTMPA